MADFQTAGVGGNDAVGPDEGLDVAQHRMLDVELFEHRLYNEIGTGAGRHLGRGGQVGARPIPCRCVNAALAELTRQIGIQPRPGAGKAVRAGVDQHGLDPGQRCSDGDAAPHGARTDDGDLSDRRAHERFSTTSATP